MVELHKACELVLPCALSTLFQTELCLAGLQACFQGVAWWSSRMIEKTVLLCAQLTLVKTEVCLQVCRLVLKESHGGVPR